MSLPPLPEMQHIMIRGIATGILTEAKVKAYGQQCREQALEEAAMAAEDGFKYDLNGYQIADKIRSLK